MIIQYRTYISFAAAAIIILLIAYLKPVEEHSPIREQLQADRFWIMKAQSKSKYDLLILGDSRCYRGVSPAEMSKSLPGFKIFNFAFSSGGLNPEMYKAASELIDESSTKKVVLLGVTFSSLLPATEKNTQYRIEHNRPHSAYLERVYLSNRLERFLPFDHETIFRLLTGKKLKESAYTSEYNDDGWVASNKTPEDTTEQVMPYQQEFERNTVNPELVKDLLAQTREWTAKGITVIGFRPPASLAMQQMEDKLGKLDMSQFQKDFETAGGKWITIDRAQYHSYDGSHINAESAIRLSQYLGEQIALLLINK